MGEEMVSGRKSRSACGTAELAEGKFVHMMEGPVTGSHRMENYCLSYESPSQGLERRVVGTNSLGQGRFEHGEQNCLEALIY